MRLNLLMLSVFMLLMVLAGALFASSLSQDAGYVLVLWQGWQLQTGIGFFLLLLLCIAVLFVLLLLLFSALSGGFGRRKKRQRHTQQLLMQLQHAMVYQILKAPEQALDRLSLQQVQQSSGWVRLAQLYFAAQIKSSEGLQAYLVDIPESHQVFAQLIQAEYYLQQQQPEHALPLLFLSYPTLPPHVPAHWHPALEQAILRLWGLYAAQQPWQMLQVEPQPALSLMAQQGWLQALWQQQAMASPEQHAQLLAYYDRQTIAECAPSVVAWLQVLMEIPIAHERAWRLTISDLQQQLHAEVLWMWLQLTLRADQNLTVDQQAEQLFASLNQRYPAQPNVRFAHACWLHANQQTDAAKQLLVDWPTTELTDRFNLLCQLDRHSMLYQRLAPVLYDFTTVESVL